MCCNDENCKAPAVNDFKMSDPDTNNTLTREAKTSCAIGEYGLMCIKDNDWICTGSTDSTIYIWPNPISSCLKQVSLRTITSTPPPSISLPPTHLPQTVLTSSTLKIVIGVLSVKCTYYSYCSGFSL